MELQRNCDHCNKPGKVAADLFPYCVAGRPNPVRRWLHRPKCRDAWYEKYREWKRDNAS